MTPQQKEVSVDFFICSGPSRLDLLFSLFDIARRRSVKFEVTEVMLIGKKSGSAEVFICAVEQNSIEEDEWHLKGFFVRGGTNRKKQRMLISFEAHYSAKYRNGSMSIATTDDLSSKKITPKSLIKWKTFES